MALTLHLGYAETPDRYEAVDCTFGIAPGMHQFCRVDTVILEGGPCNHGNSYGFASGRPCILLNLENVRQAIHILTMTFRRHMKQ